jgi:hypothetical protein
MASAATQLKTLISVIIIVWKPNINTDSIRGGQRHATTVHIIFSTDSPLLTWGDTETDKRGDSCSAGMLSSNLFSMAELL